MADSDSDPEKKIEQLIQEMVTFLSRTSGLRFHQSDEEGFCVHQLVDQKTIKFDPKRLAEVVTRRDSEDKLFVQINFNDGLKILFTDNLIGFKPIETLGLDMTKLPKVVTTPDLKSVFEALEESLSSENSTEYEINLLKKVYMAILQGGEKVGFDLGSEKRKLNAVTTRHFSGNA